jgi:hypothetical protein
MAYPDELEQRGMKNNKFHIGASDGVGEFWHFVFFEQICFPLLIPLSKLIDSKTCTKS